MASEEVAVAVEPPAETLDAARVERQVLDDVRRYFAAAPDGATDVLPGADARPSDEFVAERWFDLDPIREGTVVKWHWVREPYSLVAIQYLDAERVYRRSRPSASGRDPEGEGRTLR